MPGYFSLVVHQIKGNQPEHDLAWLKNPCARVAEVSDPRPREEAVGSF